MQANAAIRNLMLLILGPAVIAGVSLWIYLQGGRFVSTDNAYVKTEIVSVSSEITGRVVEVIPHDNERVNKGQVLFRLDDQPYRIALAKAAANLANVRGSIDAFPGETWQAHVAGIMQVLDTTIANVALPHMQGSLTATQDQVTWVLTSYIVASAIMTLPTALYAKPDGLHGHFPVCDDQFQHLSLVWTGMLQGFGLGFVFVPLSTIAYATLPAQYRAEGVSVFSLSRNMGSSVGISVVMAVLSRNMATNHAYLTVNITSEKLSIGLSQVPHTMLDNTSGMLLMLDAEVTRQAATIAYLNDFKLMMWVVLAAAPLVLLLRKRALLPAAQGLQVGHKPGSAQASATG